MHYNFKEKALEPSFCEKLVQEIKILINAGSSFTLLGMPFIGISFFLRYLATKNFAYFVYLDMHELQRRKKEELFLLLYKELGGKDKNISHLDALDACKQQLRKLLPSKQKIVILLNRLDYFNSEFIHSVFVNLKSLEDLGGGNVIFIVAASKPFYEINEIALQDEDYLFLSKVVYFPPLIERDLQKILLINPFERKANKEAIRRVFLLSGGHVTLLQLLLKTEDSPKPLDESLVKSHLKVIYESCTILQKSQLRKIAGRKSVREIDPYLLKTGMIKETNGYYELFSPLLRDYILEYTQVKLSKKERKLFYLLKQNLGRVVSKQELFEKIWGEASGEATDWALNSLIYRLRKNVSFSKSDYVIENDKSTGYKMIQEIKTARQVHRSKNKQITHDKSVYNIMINCPNEINLINKIIDVASQTGAGKIGNYSRCAMIVRGEETWISEKGAHAFVEGYKMVVTEPSVRIIMQCNKKNLHEIINAVVKVHPFEEPVIEIVKFSDNTLVKSAIRKYRKKHESNT